MVRSGMEFDEENMGFDSKRVFLNSDMKLNIRLIGAKNSIPSCAVIRATRVCQQIFVVQKSMCGEGCEFESGVRNNDTNETPKKEYVSQRASDYRMIRIIQLLGVLTKG
ncbi:hypothetical protein CTI12_AA070190 [Artemisia annua]|uniref:Uncharacterized protein n=1 Tax=Artemisia annua TaxID=35608 RepID=A0A2U1Q615_ARTAN|nr:hypothetical protein CTI12_AA070190 [Artemisia annua]